MRQDTIILLLDDHRGIYIPRDFLECFNLAEWGIDEQYCKDNAIDLEQLRKDLSSPYMDNYWDAWEDILQNAVYISNGKEMLKGHWHLYQDGALFAVHESHEFNDD